MKTRRTASFVAALALLGGLATAQFTTFVQSAQAVSSSSPVPAGAIKHVVVIWLENSAYGTSFGPASTATYLNKTLVPQGQLVENYYGTSHVSLGNYVSLVSGQASTNSQNNDCLDLKSLATPTALKGGFTDVTPARWSTMGQMRGDGCVYPANVKTVASQLDTALSSKYTYPWRAYLGDMGNDITRDYGTVDPLGGADCAHPAIGGADFSNSASATDGYATRHNAFMYFHSVIDNTALCNSRDVPMGTLKAGTNGAADVIKGHLVQDFASVTTTPAFSFIVPNLCDDGHDSKCAGADAEGTTGNGGINSADVWLKHWLPVITNSPAYKSGDTLVMISFDESGSFADTSNAYALQAGPNNKNPGFSPVLGTFKAQTAPKSAGQYLGGGKIGALFLNSKYIKPGSVNTTGYYNHYSTLKSIEDLLGITNGGTDGKGHLGFAADPLTQSFGKDIFNNQ